MLHGGPHHSQGQDEHVELLRAPLQLPKGAAGQCLLCSPVTCMGGARARAEQYHEWPKPVRPHKDGIHPGRAGRGLLEGGGLLMGHLGE